MPGLFFICMVLKIYNNMPLVTSRAFSSPGNLGDDGCGERYGSSRTFSCGNVSVDSHVVCLLQLRQ